MRRISAWRAGLAALGCAALAACKGSPDEGPWCSAGQKEPPPASAALTWYGDVRPIFDQKCARCHDESGIAPLALRTFADAQANLGLVRKVVAERSMPPFLAASCCSSYANDYSLTEDELEKVLGWIDQGGPEGDPANASPPRPPIGGLSRVDVSVKMAESYTPLPPAPSTDDTRCFVIDWPLGEAAYVTGLDPHPGNRAIVHHLVVGLVGPDDANDAVARDAKDPRPGFDCSGGFGDLRNVTSLGGSLLGGDFPRGIGTLVEPGSKILLNVHYSTAKTTGADQTTIDFRVDDTARGAQTIVVANPLWLVGDAMEIPAGEKDAVFYYKLVPELFTGRKAVELQGVVPHMHYFASQVTVRALHKDGSRSCLLEIPRWEFGWEQPYWFAQPKRLEPEDEVYVECHFDNSASNQPASQDPRDIAWGGNNQDMCSAFVTFTEVAE